MIKAFTKFYFHFIPILFCTFFTSTSGWCYSRLVVEVQNRSFKRTDRVVLFVPDAFDPNSKIPRPLMLALHGYNSNISQIRAHVGLGRFADSYGFLVLVPNGMKDSQKGRFWNATPECCDYDHKNPDDSRYLQDLIKNVRDKYAIDSKRIYVLGHSNGAYMAQRLACDTNGLFAGVVSIAGANFYDTRLCKTHTPLRFLEIHGDDDTEVPYYGDYQTATALETTKFWANLNGCTRQEFNPASHQLLRFAIDLSGRWILGLPRIGTNHCENILCINTHPETDEIRFKNCKSNQVAALWTLPGYGHAPLYSGGLIVDEIAAFLEPGRPKILQAIPETLPSSY